MALALVNACGGETQEHQQVQGAPSSSHAFDLGPASMLSASAFLEGMRGELGLGEADELVEVGSPRASADERFVVRRFVQIHDGVPVEGADCVAVEAFGSVAWVQARVAARLSLPDRDRLIGAEEAERVAHRMLEPRADDALRSELLVARLHADEDAPDHQLAYRVETTRPRLRGAAAVYVDAVTAEVLQVVPRGRHAWAETQTSATSAYEGSVTIDVQHDAAAGEYRLVTTPHALTTMELQDPVNALLAEHVVSASGAFPGEDNAVQCHWAVQRTLAYFDGEHERKSWDGAGGPVRIEMGAAAPNAVAGVDPQGELLVVVGANPTNAALTMGALDVMAHEVTHGVIDSSSDLLETSPESDALEEGFCDVFAMAVEHATLPQANWWLGEDVAQNDAHRMLDTPKSLAADTQGANAYGGDYWYCPGDCPHQKGTVLGFWFYLLTKGGQGFVDDDTTNLAYVIDGIGMKAAAAIAYDTMVSLTSAADFAEARTRSAQVASMRHGAFTPAHRTVLDAWDAVAAPGFSYAEPAITPADGAAGVIPWPTLLEWKAVAGENTYELQISESSTFATLIHSETVVTPSANNPRAEVNLEPDTTYHWRVRAVTMLGPLDWRFPASFTTHSMVPMPGSPSGSGHHPWRLPFHFTTVPSRHYDIEVHNDDKCSSPIFKKKKFDLDDIPVDTSLTLTVPVKSALSWRIASASDAARTKTSAWSACQYFQTIMPKATAESPAHNGYLSYPWPVTYTWKEVLGAEYTFEVVSLPNPPAFSWVEAGLTTTEFALNMPAHFYTASQDYTWRVGIIGPPLGSELEPEPASSRQKGLPSTDATFFLYGNDTVPASVYPPNSSLYPVCLGFNSSAPLKVRWEPVVNAEAYYVTIHEAYCPWTQPSTPCQATSTLVYEGTHAIETLLVDGSMVGVDIPASAGTLYGPTQHADRPAYWIRVKSMASNPAGIVWGAGAHAGLYWINAQTPALTSPDPGATVPRDSPVSIAWECNFAHGGGYKIKRYKGSGCSGTPAEFIHYGTHTGPQSAQIPDSAVENGKTYSWRVSSFNYDACGYPTDSLCRDFTVQDSAPPQVQIADPNQQYCISAPPCPPLGPDPELQMLFKSVNQADNYDFVIEKSIQGTYQAYDSYTVTDDDVEATAAAHSYASHLSLSIHYPNGAGTYRWKVRAVSNAGGPGPWSAWGIVILDDC